MQSVYSQAFNFSLNLSSIIFTQSVWLFSVLIHPTLGYNVKSIPAKELMFPDKTPVTVLILGCSASNAMILYLLQNI